MSNRPLNDDEVLSEMNKMVSSDIPATGISVPFPDDGIILSEEYVLGGVHQAGSFGKSKRDQSESG